MTDKLQTIEQIKISLGRLGLGAALDHAIQFIQVLATESDRGMILAGAAYIDNSLRRLLESQLVEDSSIGKLFEYNGPLGTFSSRTDLAFALGLIDRGIQCDIHLIRKIRNECAHTDLPISFKNCSVKNRIRELDLSLIHI